MSTEEQLAEFRKRKQLAQFRKLKDQSAASAPEKDEGMDLQDVRGFGQALLNGQLVGFGDEAVGLARAGLDYFYPSSWEEGAQSFPDKYKMYRDDARASLKEFREENPGTAITTEIVGGIASPINKIAPGLGTTGGTGARVLQSTVRGGIEGGIAGFGEGQGDIYTQLINAGKSAALAAPLSGALTGVGGILGKTLTKRRVAQDLGYGENYIPPNLADPEGGVGKFYRNYVGNAIGGRGGIGKQESRYLRNNPKISSLVDDPALAFPDEVGTRNAVGEVKDKLADDARKLKLALQAQKKAIKMEERSFNDIAIEYAMPDSMPESVKNQVRSSSALDADKILSRWYKDNAFMDVKGRTFDWDESLGKELKRLSEEDPDFALVLGDAASKMKGLVGRLVKEGKKATDITTQDIIDELTSGKIVGIDGDALMSMRNSFARPANVGGRTISKSYMRDIAKKFDNMIKRQLGEDSPEWARYADEISRWGDKQAISGAVRKAERQGLDYYTPKQIASSSAKGSRSPLWRSANKFIKEQEKARSRIANNANRIDQKHRASVNRLEKATLGALPENTTAFSQVASTAVLGAPVSLGVGALPAGIAAAELLKQPWAARIISGQNPKQIAMAEALRRGSTSAITGGLSREAAMALAREGGGR